MEVYEASLFATLENAFVISTSLQFQGFIQSKLLLSLLMPHQAPEIRAS